MSLGVCAHVAGVTCENCARPVVDMIGSLEERTLSESLLLLEVRRLEALVESLQRQLVDQAVRP
jgi:hypothetical protein